MIASARGITSTRGVAGALQTELGGNVIVAPHHGFGTFATPSGVPNNIAVEAIRTILLSAGWTVASGVFATGSISSPIGPFWGYTSYLGGHVASIGSGAHGSAYVYYDPSSSAPPYGFIGGYAVVAVPAGRTSIGSQANLVAAINATSPVRAVAISLATIQLTALAPGTAGNEIVVSTPGNVSIGVGMFGGGWILQSQPSTSPVSGIGNTVAIQIAATVADTENVALAIQIGSDSVNIIDFGLQQSSGWTLIADDYQAFFLSEAPPHGGDLFEFNNCVWACAPLIPANVLLSFVAFVEYSATESTVPSIGAPGIVHVDQWIGPYHHQSTTGQQGLSLGLYHSGDGSVEDRLGQPLIQPPYVLMYIDAAGESRIVGVVPDAFILSTPTPQLQLLFEQGQGYRSIGSQPSAPGSCLLMTPEVNNVATPTQSNPATQNPTYASGIGTVSLYVANEGMIMAAANADDTAQFAPDMVGGTLTIAGAKYTVLSVTIYSGGTSGITFSPPPSTTGAGIAWSIQTN